VSTPNQVTLKVWRQKDATSPGRFETYTTGSATEHMSFLELLDIVNEELVAKGKEPITFEHDCREGICGSCGFMINGVAHGDQERSTVCQTHMRHYLKPKSGAPVTEFVLEPFRAKAFPLLKDLMVDRSAFDRIIQGGGFVSVNTGNAPDGNAILVPKVDADVAMDAATCIGCGACVASCPNASAALFTSAKITHLGHLPQGQPERDRRVKGMVDAMDANGFGNCTMHGECEVTCPKGISLSSIARMNGDYLRALLKGEPPKPAGGGEG
jgi:succinate dehydrogenase / fumarate reductase iron-sulfur subunit